MVLTLRELLARIRPVGTPGAPTEGELRQRHDHRVDELAELLVRISELEAEAGQLRADAETEARRRRDAAHQQARQLLATRADRIAAARAEITATDARRDEHDEAAIDASAEQEVERLHRAAATAVPRLADRAVDRIWSVLETTPSGS